MKKSLDTHYVYGNSETEYFDVLSPILSRILCLLFCVSYFWNWVIERDEQLEH